MSYLLVMSSVAITRKLGSKVTRFNKGQAGTVKEPREKFCKFTRKVPGYRRMLVMINGEYA